MEATARNSEQRYRELAESISDPFFVLNKELRCIYWNKASEQLTGILAKDALGENIYDLFPDMEATAKAESEEAYLKAIKTRQYQRFVNEYQFGGKDFFFEITAYPSQDGISVFVKDITERRRAERELELRAQLLDAATDSITLHDFEGKFIYVNEASYKSRGYTKDELMGMKTHDLTAPEYAKSAEFWMREAQKKGEIIMQTVHLRKDKSTMPIEVHSKVIEWGGAKFCLSVARDITERKKVEERIKVFSSAVAGAIDGIAITDMKGTITYVNLSMEGLFGYNNEEMLGKSVVDLVGNQEMANEIISTLIKIGSWSGETESIKKNKEIFPAILSLSTVRDDKGTPVAMMGAVRDITRRKWAEEALNKSEQNYRELAESISDVFFAMDKELRCTYWNKASEKVTGVSAKDALGKYIFDLFPDVEATKMTEAEEAYLKARRTKHPQQFNIEYQFGGKDIVFESTAYPSQDGVSVFIRDVTDRTKAEEEVRESEQKYRQLLEDISDGYAVIQEGKYVFANRRFGEIFGYKPGQAVGKSIGQLMVPDGRRATVEQYERVMRGEEAPIERYEGMAMREDGTAITIEASIKGTQYEDKTAYSVIVRDITERKKGEELIEASLKEKETLLKEVHHRVKNNMQVISSLIRLQAGKVKDKDFAAMLKDSQNRIQSMALVYNRLYQSQNLASINMTDYIKELAVGLIKSYTTSPYRVTARIDPSNVFLGVDLAIPCGLVINELVVNSLKYAFPENSTGEIAISLKEDSNQRLELVVSDNGVGIPEGITPANTSTLGLKLVTNLVQDQLDGKIELDRSQGTTFKITFRRAKEHM